MQRSPRRCRSATANSPGTGCDATSRHSPRRCVSEPAATAATRAATRRPAWLLDQRVAGQAENPLGDLVALDLGGAARDRYGAVKERQGSAQRARPFEKGQVLA